MSVTRKSGFAGLAALSAVTVLVGVLGTALTSTAHATPISYTLNINGCSSGCGTGPFGTVTVDQDAGNANALDVSVTLNSGYAFRHANDANLCQCCCSAPGSLAWALRAASKPNPLPVCNTPATAGVLFFAAFAM